MLEHLSDEDLSQLKSLLIPLSANRSNHKRADTIAKHGFDTKFAMHCVRLALECEQLLLTGELQLDKDSQMLLSIRRGDWSLEDIQKWWVEKEIALETAYTNCKALPHKPNEQKIKELLLSCIEMHYGTLGAAIVRVPQMESLLTDLSALMDKYKGP